MKRFAFFTLAALLIGAAPAAAQSVYFGVGPTFPLGDYSDYAKTGFMIAGGVTFEVAPQLSIYGEGFWGQNNHEDEGDKTNPSGLMAGLMYTLMSGQGPVAPYVFGGGGLMTHAYKSDTFEDVSDNAFGFQLGAGLGFNLGGLDAFAEGRYTSGSFDFDTSVSETTAFLGLLVGASFNFAP